MTKKIIVAGGGHGGIVAAAKLAQAGFDVTIIERNQRENMGYDWTDIFEGKALTDVGIPMPSPEKYEMKEDMTFYSTSKNTKFKPAIPDDEREIKMERRDIYDHLIEFAERANVKFIYGCEVLGPIMKGKRVVGVKTYQGDMEADMVIDAAGIDSPVRTQLPPECNVENRFGECQQFYIYRAFYDRVPGFDTDDKYKVFLLHRGIKGISWLATEEKFTDILIGKFEPVTENDIKEALEDIRKDNPQLGTKVLRGGQKVKLPVRHPLPIFVCDGYAAIGDSAAMTIPIIGSGIAICARAGQMLANAVIADSSGEFKTESLWQYEVEYFKEIGIRLSSLDTLKIFLTKIKKDELDFLFDKGVLFPRDLLYASQGKELDIPVYELGIRGARGASNVPLLLSLVNVLLSGKIAKVICKQMPEKYSQNEVMSWAKKYDSFYKKKM